MLQVLPSEGVHHHRHSNFGLKWEMKKKVYGEQLLVNQGRCTNGNSRGQRIMKVHSLRNLK